MHKYVNYFLESKNSRLIHGHIKASDLYEKIMNHDGSTAYCCYFDLDENLLKLEWDTGKTDREGKKIYEYHLSGQTPTNPDYKCNGKTFVQYEGICRPALNMVSFDFDSDDINESLDDVRRFVNWLEVDDLVVFFSGSKGFHVMVPFGYFPLEPNEHLPNQLKDLAKHLKESYPTLDDSIYNYNRKFRVPFSQHEKTGSYKRDVLPEWSMDAIIEDAALPCGSYPHDFLKDIKTDHQPLPQITEAIEESKRKSYEVEKDRAGTIEKPSPFEKFDNKLCIKKMLENRCDDIGRNNAALRIVNDYYRTGKPQSKCEADVSSWATENGLPLSEISTIITNIYERGANYNFGCQDECKSLYCTAKCDIWKKLDPDKRPTVVDAPTSSAGNKDFKGVTWLMEKIFNCQWDEDKQSFSHGLIIKQSAHDLFYYKDNHWQHLTDDKIHTIKTKINSAFKNRLSVRDLDNIFKMFVMYVPAKPDHIDLFAPQNHMANFLDGTLHLEKGNDGYELVFKQHDKLNFCTTIIEQNYGDYLNDTGRVNHAFDHWLMDYLNDDEDSYKLIQEMFGASLMPRFPQFFVLIGKSGTGKSTTIKMLKKLHKNENNISGVSPDKFHGFHMSSMIGKLMNIVSDIKTNCRIDDDIVKQVDDQEPVRIEVKKKDDVYTTLPALHIFGANKMPATSEGYSGAMKRRFSIINFDKVYTGPPNFEIVNDMFNSDPLGVLAFALRGLERLVIDNNGRYSLTSRSQSNVDEWSKSSDALQTFLGELQEDAIDLGGTPFKIEITNDGMVSRAKLWQAYKKWQHEAIEQRNHIGKMVFFNNLSDADFKSKRKSGGHMIFGISEVTGEDNKV